MNVCVLNQCMDFNKKLEAHPFYRLLTKDSPACVSSLRAVKERLISKAHATPEEWISELVEAFQTAAKGNALISHVVKCLVQWVTKKGEKLRAREGSSWKAEVCEVYSEITELMARAPPDWPMHKKIVWMQMNGTDIEVPEVEVFEMKRVIQNELSDEERTMISQMVCAMEPDTMKKGETVVFDLAHVSNATLFAIRAFVRKREMIRTKGEGARVTLF